MGPPWTQQDISRVRELYPTHTATQIGIELSRTRRSIKHITHKFGFRKPQRDYSLNENQKQVLLGSLLGDGSIIRRNIKSYTYREPHGIGQQDYLQWKAQILGHLVSSLHPYARYDPRWNRTLWQVAMTMYGKWLKPYHDQFYPDGHKILPTQALNELTGLGVAVWFCDDGTKSSETSRLRIYTDSFTMDEAKIISKWFFDKFDIITHITPRPHKPTHPIIEVPSSSTGTFVALIKPYMPICMNYKITFREPS